MRLSDGRAQIFGWRSHSSSPRRRASGNWQAHASDRRGARERGGARERLQGVAEVLAKREAAGDAAGFDRLRAEREVLDLEADRAIASTERARAQATLASFFSGAIDPGAA